MGVETNSRKMGEPVRQSGFVENKREGEKGKKVLMGTFSRREKAEN